MPVQKRMWQAINITFTGYLIAVRKIKEFVQRYSGVVQFYSGATYAHIITCEPCYSCRPKVKLNVTPQHAFGSTEA